MPTVGKVIHNTARSTLYLGIDPGANGGIGVIKSNGEATGVPLPDTLRDLWDWFASFTYAYAAFAVIEKNTGYVGGSGNPGSAMFKFGCNTGAYLMGLTAAGIPYEEITPGVWQRGVGMLPRKRGEKKGQFKNRLKMKAQQLFPQEKVTLATADALLIALYCRRKHELRKIGVKI